MVSAVSLAGSGVASDFFEHKVYFEKTDFELHVFKIKGEEKGNTLMIIGGIQGDEPGGYISADLYADIRLKKGNIIVVPRANLISILANKRQINQDMNRRFDKLSEENIYEDKIVSVLKALMQESDLLLNLHEGSGFFNPKYIDRMNNPYRFGQSIIADADSFKSPRCNCELKLREMAERVIEKVNPKIRDEKLKFRFNNHNTFSKKTIHPEQRKSATYYALSVIGIPAFGVEASKSIRDLSTKVYMHSMVINAFMKEMDIEFATPSIELVEPSLKYI
ncbi:MAG: succinylglutamate desuccinylase/aspartoacylase family protein, partial [Oligoflexia bacterium]|nr:succinylglutamate desuccinylase/aspartoacylase family protein [Oligoflexia bacterium]